MSKSFDDSYSFVRFFVYPLFLASLENDDDGILTSIDFRDSGVFGKKNQLNLRRR
jgi:hypothetical protein